MSQTLSSDKAFVSELEDKQTVESVFLVKDKMLLTDKNGKPYLNLYLADVTGSMNARLWERADEYVKSFDVGDFVHVKGHVQLFQRKKQLVVHGISRAEPGEYELSDFLLSARRPAEDMMADLEKLIAEMQSPQFKQLIENTLSDSEVRALFMKVPAAKTIHHAYVGGLLEHVLSMGQTMKFMAQHYPALNYDLLLFGAIYHDIGKIWELTIVDGVQYTNRGRLVGHMAIACELIDKMSSGISGFSQEQKDICKHIVLSHHGKLEYGSPKRPKFLEAYVVAMVDEFDSKMNTMETFMRSELENQASWTRYEPQFDRYFFLPVFAEQVKKVQP